MERTRASSRWNEWKWLAKWAVIFALGCIGLASDITVLKIFGAFIVFPTLLSVAIFLYGGMWWKVVKLFGGDPKEIWFPWFVILSFTTLLFLASAGRHHH